MIELGWHILSCYGLWYFINYLFRSWMDCGLMLPFVTPSSSFCLCQKVDENFQDYIFLLMMLLKIVLVVCASVYIYNDTSFLLYMMCIDFYWIILSTHAWHKGELIKYISIICYMIQWLPYESWFWLSLSHPHSTLGK